MASAESNGDLTTSEAWDELNCSNKKGWDLLNTGEIEGYYVGRTMRIIRESIAQYKKRNKYRPRSHASEG